jgi:hypothetical protein
MGSPSPTNKSTKQQMDTSIFWNFPPQMSSISFFMNISNTLPKLLVTDVQQIPDMQTYQNWTKELNCFKVLHSVYSYMQNFWQFSQNVNVNKCEKTCVEYIKKFKVSNSNFKQITRLFAIFHLFFEYLKPWKLEIHASQIIWIFLFKYQSI